MNDGINPEANGSQSFINGWLRQARELEHLDDDLLDILDEHLSDSNLDEAGLLHALIDHADIEHEEGNGSTSE